MGRVGIEHRRGGEAPPCTHTLHLDRTLTPDTDRPHTPHLTTDMPHLTPAHPHLTPNRRSPACTEVSPTSARTLLSQPPGTPVPLDPGQFRMFTGRLIPKVEPEHRHAGRPTNSSQTTCKDLLQRTSPNSNGSDTSDSQSPLCSPTRAPPKSGARETKHLKPALAGTAPRIRSRAAAHQCLLRGAEVVGPAITFRIA